MADSNQDILGPTGPSYSSTEEVTFTGRVTPTDGTYRSGLPVKIIQQFNDTETLITYGTTDSDGYYSLNGYFTADGHDIETIATVGNDVSDSIYVYVSQDLAINGYNYRQYYPNASTDLVLTISSQMYTNSQLGSMKVYINNGLITSSAQLGNVTISGEMLRQLTSGGIIVARVVSDSLDLESQVLLSSAS